MINCDKLIHPFQNEPGTSQRQRVMDDLLSGSAKIDGRNLADLLDYFVQLSRHVNFYDSDLNISDWQPFFQKSIPFSLAAIIKYNREGVNEKIDTYTKLFVRKPSRAGLQLLFHYFYQQVISQVNNWHLQLKGSGLPAELIVEKLIRDKLKGPLEKFICYHNAAVKWYCIKPIDFNKLAGNPVWSLNLANLSANADNCKPAGKTKRKRLLNLHQQVRELLPSFTDSIRIISGTAELSMEQSLIPLKEEFQKQHSPHLALLFSFLKLFRYLQDDLNAFTKKHLDYFYKQVLKLKSRDAIADRLHIVFEIQKQLEKYLLKKGLTLKDGKDVNKAEILFATDDEIVVNKTQVADKRTLFLNNRDILESAYLEGVYMASNVDKADGVKQDFNETDPKSFATVGAKLSKYRAPGKTLLQPYPNARLGFILASPVLLLNEGTRTIDITIACRLTEDFCNEMNIAEEEEASANCCDEAGQGNILPVKPKYPSFIKSSKFLDDIADAMNETYRYISEDLIVEAAKKGISKEIEKNLRDFLVIIKTRNDLDTVCYCPVETNLYDVVLTEPGRWNSFYTALSDQEKIVVDKIFTKRKVFQVLFSGENEWISPVDPCNVSLVHPVPGNDFRLKISAVIKPDQPAISFFDSEKLKEDFNTTQPLVKIELDDKIKLKYSNAALSLLAEQPGNDNCCLLRTFPDEAHEVSLYHFFRNVVVVEKSGNDPTRIDVSVCGLRKFIVQNEESVQDVNGPVYPFGTRPDIVEFSVVNPVACITLAFINDAAGLSLKAKNFLQGLLTPQNQFRKAIAKNELEVFLDQKDSSNNPIFNNSDKTIIRGLINNPAKKYCLQNQAGPEFYIGSREVFGKNWNAVRINLNWKDKPMNFRDYYSAYVVEDVAQQVFGLDENNFKVRLAALKEGKWLEEVNDRKLFDATPPPAFLPCITDNSFSQGITVVRSNFFPGNQPFTVTNEKDKPFAADTRSGFIKLSLREQDFLHKDYGFILARQMMALGKYPDAILEGAVYRKEGDTVLVFRNLAKTLINLKDEIIDTRDAAEQAMNKVAALNTTFDAAVDFPPPLTPISNGDRNVLIPLVHDSKTLSDSTFQLADDTKDKLADLFEIIDIFHPVTFEIVKPLTVLIPNEPWTPIIKNISLDYTATATINDIDLIHLYPYAGTYKKEDFFSQPMLLPTFCDEGTLFIGLKDLVPGSNVNMLFQLAEATADSESDREEPVWHYLDNNKWKALRNGFEVLDDDTDGLTTSGIIKFALPANMTKDNTILPKDLHWIRVTVPKNSKTVSETIGIYTQAIRATFTNEVANDKTRLSAPLSAGAVTKLNEADANVKKLIQPFDSFGGRLPEAEGHFYVRISELLRHRGRAIQKFDYERLALEAFPQLYKVKCINHSFALNAYKYKNDFPVAPGYVILAVIPDLNQLKAAKSFEPRVPVSMLEDIQESMKKLTSPFVRFRAMNPRYEKVHFCLTIKLVKGKDENYYKEKVKQDLGEFMAPWAVGKFDKLSFGQCVNRSDLIRFLESLDYIDYIVELIMWHDDDLKPQKNDEEKLRKPVCPKTPRSILIAGSIDVCIPSNECEAWQDCDDEEKKDCCDNEKIPIANYCKPAIG